MTVSMRGIVYLIQPAELVSTRRYKIGCSKKPTLEQCMSGYITGSRYICIMECNDPHGTESKIKGAFNNKYKRVAGYEYYEIDEDEVDMIRLFTDTVIENMDDDIDIQGGDSENKDDDIDIQGGDSENIGN